MYLEWWLEIWYARSSNGKKNTYPWIRILRCIGRSNEGRWMVICILGKEDEWTCCVNWIYFISCVIYSFILCFIGLIYINRYWWPVCLIYHKIGVILSYNFKVININKLLFIFFLKLNIAFLFLILMSQNYIQRNKLSYTTVFGNFSRY